MAAGVEPGPLAGAAYLYNEHLDIKLPWLSIDSTLLLALPWSPAEALHPLLVFLLSAGVFCCCLAGAGSTPSPRTCPSWRIPFTPAL
jgi:hypothetical protein